MLGLTTTFAPFGTNVPIPPKAAIARRTRSSGAPLRATAMSGRFDGADVAAGCVPATWAVSVVGETGCVGGIGATEGEGDDRTVFPQAASSPLNAVDPMAAALILRKSRRLGLAICDSILETDRIP